MDPSLTDKDGKQDAKEEDDDEKDELHGHEATAFRTESQGRRRCHPERSEGLKGSRIFASTTRLDECISMHNNAA